MPKPNIEFSVPNIENFNKNRPWSNKDNVKFYEKMSNELYEKLVKNSGIDKNQDIESIRNYILNAKSVFEVGLCRGRVIKACQNIGYQGKFSGIEMAQNFCEELKHTYPDVTMFEGDFLEFIGTEKYDLVLLMGSTFGAFFPKEQKVCIEKVSNILKPGGYLIIDNYIGHGKSINDGSLPAKNDGFYVIQVNGEYYAGYFSTIQEINNMTKELGFMPIEENRYVANNDVHRISLIYRYQ